MKKLISLFTFLICMTLFLKGQKVSNFTYSLDNGINIKMEKCWNQVWVSQRTDALQASDKVPLVLSTRSLGELVSGSSFKLFSAGKEVKVQDAKPGIFTLKFTAKLAGKPGNISFDVENIEVKAKSKTTVSVILYNYQVNIDAVAGSQKGLAAFSSGVERYKGLSETNPSCGVPAFYAKGAHDKALTPSELSSGNKKGKIQPGAYDVLLTLGNPASPQKIWLENFQMKADMTYNITINLNAGLISYNGTNKDVKAFHLYPGGTADRQKGAATYDKSQEIIRCETQSVISACPPGTYDVLLEYGNGSKFEWRKNIAVSTGKRSEVK